MRQLIAILLPLLVACDGLWSGLIRPHVELAWPSRSGTVAMSEDDQLLVAVNPDHGSIAIFDVAVPDGESTSAARLPRRLSVVATGDTPSAVALHPDRQTAFVAHRGDGTVVRVNNVQSPQPQVVARVAVGAEPMALALSPLGRRLFVAEYAEGSVAVIDTDQMVVQHILLGIRSPRALLVTNNADGNESDEILIVAEYFGTQSGGADLGADRSGRIRLFSLADYREVGEIPLSALPAERAGFGEAAWANQLAGLAMADDGMLFVVGSAASSAAPNDGPRAVNPVVHVIDVGQRIELSGELGSFSLAQRQQEKGRPDLWFAADPVAIDFVVKKSVGYVVARGAQVVLRIAPNPANQRWEIGSQKNDQIDLGVGSGSGPACEAPTGGVIGRRSLVNSQRMFINCWLSRRLVVVDFNQQVVEASVSLVDDEPLPSAQLRGKQAFYSARGRSSRQGWLSCASCHPDGRSDGVTWVWAQGPRQTPSLDGLFPHGASAATSDQRVHGWTATADEVHDQEALLRSVQGGIGHLTQAMTPEACGDARTEQSLPLYPALGRPNRDVQLFGPSCATTWDDIEQFLRTLRPTPARRRLSPDAVARGRLVFMQSGRCQTCHGGPGWSISRRFYVPSQTQNEDLALRVPFVRPATWPASYSRHNGLQISDEPGPTPGSALPPPQLACALRHVGSYGSQAIEQDELGHRAQGQAGYTVPSLYSLGLSAPYLHHGQAATLDDLLDSEFFASHRRAAAENFSPTPSERADLASFLLSIDERTDEIAVPAGFDSGCATR